jgi:hypothetical protein
MDLRHPLRSLIPSLDSAVLEVLAGAKTGLGVSQITRLAAKGTRPGLTAVLDRLVAHGVVLAEPANQGFLYRLNRDHLLAPVVVATAAVRGTLIARLTDAVDGFAPQPAHASLFGSFARGEADADSDIDLLLIAGTGRDAALWDDSAAQLRDRVFRWTGNRCQLMVLTVPRLRQLAAANEPIVANWLADGLLLSGAPLADLLSTAKRTSRA